MVRILFFVVIVFLGFGFTTFESHSVESSITLENKIIISPNPATTVTKVFSKNPSKKIKSVEVYSMVNEKVMQKSNSFPTQSVELRVMNLRSGKYFVKVFLSDGTEEIATLIKIH